jgi:probable phosphoglycerate mutase
MAIFVIRHGETTSNAARIIQEPTTPLNARGIAQAERVAERLARAGVVRILSSDLARALMTAECVHARTGAPIDIDPELAERDFGKLRGTPYAELTLDPFAAEYAPPGGESLEAFHARVARAWARVARTAGETVGHLAVITHGLVCGALAERHLSVRDGHELPGRWENAGLTEVDGTPPWTVRVMNCTAHLDAAPGTAVGRAGEI